MKAEKTNIIEEVLVDIIEPAYSNCWKRLISLSFDPANSRGEEFKRGPWSITSTISRSLKDK